MGRSRTLFLGSVMGGVVSFVVAGGQAASDWGACCPRRWSAHCGDGLSWHPVRR